MFSGVGFPVKFIRLISEMLVIVLCLLSSLAPPILVDFKGRFDESSMGIKNVNR